MEKEINEEQDIEVTEISLSDEEIDEWIVQLAMLVQSMQYSHPGGGQFLYKLWLV